LTKQALLLVNKASVYFSQLLEPHFPESIASLFFYMKMAPFFRLDSLPNVTRSVKGAKSLDHDGLGQPTMLRRSLLLFELGFCLAPELLVRGKSLLRALRSTNPNLKRRLYLMRQPWLALTAKSPQTESQSSASLLLFTLLA
jgi:hypothetical protein